MSEITNVDNSFRMKLYNWRMANNLSKREAAVTLGTTQAQLYRWEQGKHEPRITTIAKLMPIIDSAPAPVKEPEEELWVPETTEPDEPVYTARPMTFRERMEQRHGGMDEYFAKTKEAAEELEKVEETVKLVAELPLAAEPKPDTALKLAKVIGFLECLALYAAEGVAEPLEQQIKTLQDIAEEMSA